MDRNIFDEEELRRFIFRLYNEENNEERLRDKESNAYEGHRYQVCNRPAGAAN